MSMIETVKEELDKKQQYLKLDPENERLIVDVADLHVKLGEFERANTLLESALVKNPKSIALQYSLATSAIANSEAEKAISILQDILSAGNFDPAFHYNIGYAYLLMGKPAEAREHLESIQEHVDQIPSLFLLLARTYHHLGDLNNAEISVRKYLDRYPEDAEALGLMALLELDSESSTAIEWAEKSLAIDENSLEGLVTKGSVALSELDPVDARGFFTKATTHHKKSGRAWAGLGLVDMANMDLEKARSGLEKAVKYMPNHIGTWHALAWCQLLSSDLVAARQSFESAMEIDRNFGETHGGLAVLAAMEGRVEEAKSLSKKAIGLNSNSFSARYAQSLILVQKGRPETATKLIQKTLESEVTKGQGTLNQQLLKLQKKLSQNNKPQGNNKSAKKLH